MQTSDLVFPLSGHAADAVAHLSLDGNAPDERPSDTHSQEVGRDAGIGSSAEVDVSARGGVTVVTVSGSLDSQTHSLFVTALQSIIARHHDLVVVDMLNVDFMGTQCIESLLDFGSLASSHDVGWVLCSLRAVTRPLQMLGIAEEIPMADSLDEAIGLVGRRATLIDIA